MQVVGGALLACVNVKKARTESIECASESLVCDLSGIN